jgi:hypothetical protein
MIIAAGIILLALALLVTRDVCRWMGRRLEIWLARSEDQIEGHPFDASVVTPRISAVRRDYLTEIHAREHESEYHEELLESARRTVSRLAFFQRQDHVPDPQMSDT